ncbi:hypothetical protein SAMN05443248_3018 [Bradyrhizobium erythrophlei]|uniref:Uncharacterized protein n=1 Tax=Bradyrhizobium erythrophlei TaxID=1437360 RepID=A0A1M5NJC6_9BRAD|nr:hypothetical protein SAMN05443248_3018 [Bradyrhizobium erythrophlei]
MQLMGPSAGFLTGLSLSPSDNKIGQRAQCAVATTFRPRPLSFLLVKQPAPASGPRYYGPMGIGGNLGALGPEACAPPVPAPGEAGKPAPDGETYICT